MSAATNLVLCKKVVAIKLPDTNRFVASAIEKARYCYSVLQSFRRIKRVRLDIIFSDWIGEYIRPKPLLIQFIMLSRLLVLMLLAFAAKAALAQSAIEAERNLQISRYLKASDFVEYVKIGIRRSIAREGRSNPCVDDLLAAPEDAIIKAATPAYSERLSLAEARLLADLYTSETGQSLLRQLRASRTLEPKIDLNPPQQAELRSFDFEEAKRALSRVQNPEHQRQVVESIATMFPSCAR